VLREGSKLRVMPLIQMFLFEGHGNGSDDDNEDLNLADLE
jgi:hypothetical protein